MNVPMIYSSGLSEPSVDEGVVNVALAHEGELLFFNMTIRAAVLLGGKLQATVAEYHRKLEEEQ